MICSGAFSRVSASENSEAFGDAQRHPQTADEVLIFQAFSSTNALADGGGLYVEVQPAGKKVWRM